MPTPRANRRATIPVSLVGSLRRGPGSFSPLPLIEEIPPAGGVGLLASGALRPSGERRSLPGDLTCRGLPPASGRIIHAPSHLSGNI